MIKTINRLPDERYEANEFVDDLWKAKNSADAEASSASEGRSIKILLLSTEKRRLRSPMYTMITKVNTKPAVSRATSIGEAMPKLKPTNDELKGQKIMTRVPIKKSPKAKC